jgi:hypothetical protein
MSVKVEIAVKTKVDGKTYEISELIKFISYTDNLNDGCSKLEFTYIGGDLLLQNADALWLKYDGSNIFYGYVFKVIRNSSKEISVTAYDQLRYAKAKDYLYSSGDTATSLVNKMCSHFNFVKGVISNTSYVLKDQAYDGDTWLDVVYSGIGETLIAKSKFYCLRDEFGEVTLRDLDDLRIDLMLGDKSMCYKFTHEKSIDENFYNQILLLVEIKTGSGSSQTSTAQIVGTKSDTSIKAYGMMQYYEKVQNSTAAQAKEKAIALLKLYNRESETLTLECLGDKRIRAGSSFSVYISDLDINQQMYVKSVTHSFVPIHTMSIEVSI